MHSFAFFTWEEWYLFDYYALAMVQKLETASLALAEVHKYTNQHL